MSNSLNTKKKNNLLVTVPVTEDLEKAIPSYKTFKSSEWFTSRLYNKSNFIQIYYKRTLSVDWDQIYNWKNGLPIVYVKKLNFSNEISLLFQIFPFFQFLSEIFDNEKHFLKVRMNLDVEYLKSYSNTFILPKEFRTKVFRKVHLLPNGVYEFLIIMKLTAGI